MVILIILLKIILSIRYYSVPSPGEISINSDQSDFKQYVTREQELRAMEMKSIMEKDRQILKINSLLINRFMSEEA